MKYIDNILTIEHWRPLVIERKFTDMRYIWRRQAVPDTALKT